MVVLINPRAGKSGHAASRPETRIAAFFAALGAIRIEQPNITIERRAWRRNSGAFNVLSIERFHRSKEGWIRK
jgi:hypothetical protein